MRGDMTRNGARLKKFKFSVVQYWNFAERMSSEMIGGLELI
jgi:hypothetical protein